MKKICFIIDGIKNSGGRERVISLLANEFVLENKVSILVLDNNRESFYKLDERIDIINVVGTNKLDTLKKLKSFFKEHDDMIYMTLSMRFLNLFVGIAARGTKAKIIATEHCDYFTTPKVFRGLKQIVYKRFNYIVTLTEKDRDVIRKFSKNCVQINNPCSFKVDEYSNHNNKVILNVGRLTEQKGQDMLLEAWKKTDKKDWKLKIVGDGELKEELLAKRKKLELEDSVIFLEPTKEIDKIYKSSDIFVLSSRWEGLPMVLIEAMAFGLPCISFDCETGPRQLIDNNISGLLAKANDTDELSEKMGELINNREKMLEMSEKAISKAAEFDIKKISKIWYDLMNEI